MTHHLQGAIAHDESIYERPDDFWPDRYILSEFGTKPGVDTTDFRHTLPYGSGKVRWYQDFQDYETLKLSS